MPEPWRPSGPWKARFRKALQLAYDEGSLELLTADYFTPAETLSQIAAPGSGPLEVRIHKLIEQARMGDWLADLVAAAAERRPRNAELEALASEVGLTLLGPRVDSAAPLEAIVNKEAKLISFADFVERLPDFRGRSASSTSRTAAARASSSAKTSC